MTHTLQCDCKLFTFSVLFQQVCAFQEQLFSSSSLSSAFLLLLLLLYAFGGYSGMISAPPVPCSRATNHTPLQLILTEQYNEIKNKQTGNCV